MIGIGIDTGGTCTDAVIYDIESKEVLASAKTLTTKGDLKKGIENALLMLPEEELAKCSQIALSTTLATNACVENIAGRGRLILIGVNPKIFNDTYKKYGFTDTSDTYLLKADITSRPETTKDPDWDTFRLDMQEFLKDCECCGIVQMYATSHTARHEKEAAAIIRELYDFPIILGHDLFPDLNAIRRGAGALLNARLVPVVYSFMEAIREVFAAKNLDLPTTIIRSDGTQMSKSFALHRPVETLLCGPAASVIGARVLSDVSEAMIIDIGGTTTDIALIYNHKPLLSEDGIQIGHWKTFVKGLFVDTFGLGGDSAIHYEFNGHLYLEQYRIISLCSLAKRYPQVLEHLQALAKSSRVHPKFLHEFYVFIHFPTHWNEYSDLEKNFLEALKEHPISIEDAARMLKTDVYGLDLSRMEKEGLIIRAGLTPTDIMHVKGDFNGFCTQASQLAAEYVSRCCNVNSVEDLCNQVYELFEKKLYTNILRIYLQQEWPDLKDRQPDEQLEKLFSYAFDIAKKESICDGSTNSFSSLFQLKPTLVGVGAPTHVFLPHVAKLLGTTCETPKYANVANAIGAIASEIVATEEIRIRPLHIESEGLFEVLSRNEKRNFVSYQAAYDFALEEGKHTVREKALEQGAQKDIEIQVETIKNEGHMRYGSVWFYDTIRFTAKGELL